MRIVWTSATFIAGVGAAIAFGFAPGHAVPTSTFLLLCGTATVISLALVVSRRKAAIALLCLVFLIGSWRGTDGVQTFENPERRPFTTSSDPIDPSGALGRIRKAIADDLDRSHGPIEDGLAAALLVGDRSQIGERTTRDFRAAGLAHLLAISGLHVSLLGGSMMAISVAIFGRRRAFYLVIPLLIVLVYAALAGFAPPIVRAAIMFSVFILGRSLGRGSHTVGAIAVAALVMVLHSPEILASLSFQLSFAAMLAIAFVTPIMDGFTELTTADEKKTRRFSLLGRVRHFVLGSLAVSLASTIGTLPLVALHFDVVPVWGAIATILALPAVPLLVLLSAVLVIAGQISLPLFSEIVAIPVNALTAYVYSVASVFARLPPGPIDTSPWKVWMTVTYLAFVVSLVLSWPWSANSAKQVVLTGIANVRSRRVVKTAPYYPQLVLATSLLVLGAAAWGAALANPSAVPFLSVRFFETTLGESILIETPHGNRILIDGGGDDAQIAETLTEMIPFTDRNIDIVMLTHTDSDHVGGLPEVLERFRTDTVIHSGIHSSSEAFSSWIDAINDHDDIKIAYPGMFLVLDEDIFLEVINSGCLDTTIPCADDNDSSIVSILKFGQISFLLTGDIEGRAEKFLASNHRTLHATVLKAPHHGSITSSTEAFLNAVKPTAIVVAVGSQNRYGHPHPDVMSRLIGEVGTERVFRTDRLGTLEFQTDGERLWMVR